MTEGKPVVTDIIGDEVEVLGLAASLEEASQHPLAEAVVKRASELDLSFTLLKISKPCTEKVSQGKSMENKFCWKC